MKTNKVIREHSRRLIAVWIVLLGGATSAAAQTVVTGTGDPNIDVPAVQAAVDQGGDVVLSGHFSFDRPPTVSTAAPALAPAMVLISKQVAVSGESDEDGATATIEAGSIPFYVDARGAHVTIRGLRFVRPKADAIFVYSVSGLVIASCQVEGVDPVTHSSNGIEVNTSGLPPTPTSPGKPENVSGTLLIVNNDIDVAGGTAQDNTVGILLFSVGVPGAEVEAYVSGNNVRNTTQPGINLRRIGGRAFIERNVITTGSVSGGAPVSQAIRVANSGSYLISHNWIDCGWAHSDAQGIGVFSQFAEWPIDRAVVVDNHVTMSPPEGTVFNQNSAAIAVRGFAQNNVVLGNRIRGRARAALALDFFRGGTPRNTSLVVNRFDDFEPTLADIFVDNGVINTLIVGDGTVEDHGTGTVIIPE